MNIRLSARTITSRIDDISDSIRDKLSTGLDILLTVEETLKKFDIDFSKCSSITTDSAKAMIDLKKGFAGQLKQRNLNIPIIHCILHQEALAGKVVKLSTAMEITKIINEIKGGHKFLTNRKFKLFLEEHKAVYTDVSLYCPIRWLSALEDVTELAFITDISNQVRLLNLKLQRTNQNISQLVRHIDSFRRKLQILKSHLNDIFHFFPSCQILLEEHDNNCNFKEYIHFLDSLIDEFDTRFICFEKLRTELILFENPPPLTAPIEGQHLDLQDELCDLQNDIALKTLKKLMWIFTKCWKNHHTPIFEISDFKFIPYSDLHIYVRHPFQK
ncbi:GTD2B protein, partial [Acromyrmex heyeri]